MTGPPSPCGQEKQTKKWVCESITPSQAKQVSKTENGFLVYSNRDMNQSLGLTVSISGKDSARLARKKPKSFDKT